MESEIALITLERKWAVATAVAVIYDYFLTLDAEIKYIWSRKITSAGAIYIVIRYSSFVSIIIAFLDCFPWSGKSSPMYARGRALLGSGNAVPSLYAAIKTRSAYDPGPNNLLTLCNADFSQFESFRKGPLSLFFLGPRRGTAQQGLIITTAFFQNGVAYFTALLVGNIMNLAFINNVQLLFNLIGALTAMTVILTCRFILDLFEASTRGRFGTIPTLHLSAMAPAPRLNPNSSPPRLSDMRVSEIATSSGCSLTGGDYVKLIVHTGAPGGWNTRQIVHPPGLVYLSQETPFAPPALGTGPRTQVYKAPRGTRCTVRSRRSVATGADLSPSTTQSVDGVGYIFETDVTATDTE
ncbi:uncharacterized protein BXZ73DRAFT_98078 [Epithele typhae]|uniref:uncharacterized protein n=1 Tax=Epithele typhae TaxID=378194 RepID=UPI002007C736|nr:uncharacterized protein BXZ73DRAFT_98078 [Epithele typhae]KAH9941688.1 hypothetical protein BXZ73DRAFT_98078 [Epithele typhae]